MATRFLYSIVFLLFLSSFSLYAQKGKEARGNEAYEAGEYFKAINLYKDAYQNMTDKERKKEILFRIANCYRLIHDYKKAEMWFKKVVKKEYPNPNIYLYLAEAMKMNGNYEDAIEQFTNYKELVPDDPKGDMGIESCNIAMDWLENPTGYQGNEMKFFNSKQSDFSPTFASADYGTVYFTSLREESTGSSTHGATGYNFADIYMSVIDRKGKWSTPVPLGETINTEFEEGVCSFNKDYSVMYYCF